MSAEIESLINHVEALRAKAIKFPRKVITPTCYAVVEQIYNRNGTIKIISRHPNTVDAMLSLKSPGVVATLDSKCRPIEFFEVTAAHIKSLAQCVKNGAALLPTKLQHDTCANI